MNKPAPFFAFPLLEVAPASDQRLRRSEASMVTLRDGGCLLAYASHQGRSDNDQAPLVGVTLDASGEVTSPERVIVPPPENGLNSMSPALQRLPDDRIGMLYSHRLSQKSASRLFIASADEGQTWSPAVIVAEGAYKTGCHDRFTVHSSGRLLAPCHCTDDWDDHHLHVRVARSDDAGASWQLGAALELPRVRWPEGSGGGGLESGCIEPGIAERADGSLLMTLRTAMGTQFCSESFDRGDTWSPPRSLEVISPVAPAHLSRLPGSDNLLLIWTSDYDARAPLAGQRHTIMTCVSTDGGLSWPHSRRQILARDLSRSVDYPSVLFRDGQAWITLRVSTGSGVLEGRTSTVLMRVPLTWFNAS